MIRWAQEHSYAIIIILLAVVTSCLLARSEAGSWNDGSRLASIEALVDHGTFAIDDSIFVQVPELRDGQASPYPTGDGLLQKYGTKDKLYIRGHYYTDKTPLPSYYLAGVYQCFRWLGGPSAHDRPDRFCRLMVVASSGVSFVLAVWGIFSIAML